MTDDPTLHFRQPENPQVGDIWVVPTTYLQRVWDGEQWIESGECGGTSTDE